MKTLFTFKCVILCFGICFAQIPASHVSSTLQDNAGVLHTNHGITSVSLFGGGSLLSTAQSSSAEGSNPLAGLIGVVFEIKDIHTCAISFGYNGVDSSSVALLSDLGGLMLVPSTAGNFFNLDLMLRLWSISAMQKFGGCFNLLAAQNHWTTDSTTSFQDGFQFVTKFGVFYAPFSYENNENKVNFIIKPQLTYRSLLGDLGNTQPLFVEGNELEHRSFWGAEISAHLFVNVLEAYISVNWNDNDWSGVEIPGFSNWQARIGVVVSADMIKI